jgi:hypothetical protein
MTIFEQIRDVSWPLSLALAGIWAFRLLRLGLAKRYPALMTYLVVACAAGGAAYFIRQLVDARLLGHSIYFWYWAVMQPILWLLLFAVLYECFNRMAEGYDGLRRFGRTVVYGLAGGVVFAGALIWILDPYETPDLRFWNGVLLTQQQSVYFANAGSVLLLLAVRRFFQLPVPRNVAITLGAFGVYFVSVASMTAVRMYVGHSLGNLNGMMDAAGLVIYCLCLLFGAVAFSRHGEIVARDRRFDMPTRETLAAASSRLQEVHDQLTKAVVR